MNDEFLPACRRQLNARITTHQTTAHQITRPPSMQFPTLSQKQFCCLTGSLAVLALAAAFWDPSPLVATAGLLGLTYAGLRTPTGRLLQRSFQKDNPPSVAEPPPEPAVAREGSDGMVDELIRQGRYALLLRSKVAAGLSQAHRWLAQSALEDAMTVVPDGEVALRSEPEDDAESADDPRNDLDPEAEAETIVNVESLLLDRHPITNRQYQSFVDAGGYTQMDLWDPQIWAAVLEFVDETGAPGPRFWREGRCEPGKEDHPVVGVCWYEAAAYARWAGKRLPSDAEWVKAACWPSAHSGTLRQRRYPWGESLDPNRANLWAAGLGRTCDVAAFESGVSVGGVYGLIGNVWEWTSTEFGRLPGRRAGTRVGQFQLDASLKSLRGGAFDTYFDNQATCHFQSADDPLARKHNVGFRTALSLCDVLEGLAA